jgi:hypothetical protein
MNVRRARIAPRFSELFCDPLISAKVVAAMRWPSLSAAGTANFIFPPEVSHVVCSVLIKIGVSLTRARSDKRRWPTDIDALRPGFLKAGHKDLKNQRCDGVTARSLETRCRG